MGPNWIPAAVKARMINQVMTASSMWWTAVPPLMMTHVRGTWKPTMTIRWTAAPSARAWMGSTASSTGQTPHPRRYK